MEGVKAAVGEGVVGEGEEGTERGEEEVGCCGGGDGDDGSSDDGDDDV